MQVYDRLVRRLAVAAYVIALTAHELAPALVLRLVRLLFLVLVSMTVAPLPQEYEPVRNIRGGVKLFRQ